MYNSRWPAATAQTRERTCPRPYQAIWQFCALGFAHQIKNGWTLVTLRTQSSLRGLNVSWEIIQFRIQPTTPQHGALQPFYNRAEPQDFQHPGAKCCSHHEAEHFMSMSACSNVCLLYIHIIRTYLNEYLHTWTDRQMDGWTHGRMDGWSDR